MKKYLILPFIILFLTSCQNTSINESISDASDISISTGIIIEEKEGLLYSPVLKDEQLEGASYFDYALSEEGKLKYITLDELGENRAFVSISSFIENYYMKHSYFKEYEISYENDAVTFTFDSSKYITFDHTNDTISSNDIASIGAKGIAHSLDVSDLERYENTHIELTEVLKNIVTPTTIDMGSHNLDIIYANSTVYLPVLIVSSIFLYAEFITMAFNGTNFYITNDPSTLIVVEPSPNDFGESYYETSTMKETSIKSQAEADHDANIFLFIIDYFYGFMENRGFKNGYGAYLKEDHPDVYNNLFSTDAETAYDAYDYVILSEMGDGHSNIYGVGGFYNGGQHTIDAQDSTRYTTLINLLRTFSATRNEVLGLNNAGLGDKYLEISSDGETAIIRFDVFLTNHYAPNQSDEFYESHVEDDNFSLFYTCFRKIKEIGTVKNVIIDVSCNSGGYSESLICDLGFIIDNPSINVYDTLSGGAYKAKYRTDTNANGSFEIGESPANDYEMYVLTSSFSFSCANAFPYFAKEEGVKIMGLQSGGGQCCICSYLLPDGYPVQISYSFVLGRDENRFTNMDNGVPVDIEVPLNEGEGTIYDNFYKIDVLSDLIKNDQNAQNS